MIIDMDYPGQHDHVQTLETKMSPECAKHLRERSTCCSVPETPPLYEACIVKDIQDQYEHALDMLKKCHPEKNRQEWEFFIDMMRAYSRYCASKEFDA